MSMILASLKPYFDSLATSLITLGVQALPGQAPGQNVDPRQMLLAQLKDIKTPESLGWWPPAPGWWILGALIIGGLVAAVLFILKRRQQGRYRKIALEELAQISRDEKDAAKAIMHLLKRVCFTAYPKARDALANTYGAEFLRMLQKLSPKIELPSELESQIAALMYRPAAEDGDQTAALQKFKDFARAWIEGHPKNSPRVRAIIDEAQNTELSVQRKSMQKKNVEAVSV